MTEIAIRVENLGKKYYLGSRRGTSSLRDAINQAAVLPFTAMRSRFNGTKPDAEDNAFWALQRLSFSVNEGEVLGIVGRNGSGKSTLLKMLACITRPTTGRFEIHGRLGALLEVGTGFHPDLTGRENVFLNGSLLGMRRSEIAANFDSIVDFSGVEKFIDTQVKYYSSGMQVRLAFAVSVHLNTDVLLLDEVLAVGDMGFQKKSLDKLAEIAKGGRTILLVGHSMPLVEQLSTRVLLLRDGQSVCIGDPQEVITAYRDYELAEVEA